MQAFKDDGIIVRRNRGMCAESTELKLHKLLENYQHHRATACRMLLKALENKELPNSQASAIYGKNFEELVITPCIRDYD